VSQLYESSQCHYQAQVKTSDGVTMQWQYICLTCETPKMVETNLFASGDYFINTGCETCETIRRFRADYSKRAAQIKGWL